MKYCLGFLLLLNGLFLTSVPAHGLPILTIRLLLQEPTDRVDPLPLRA
ncbi:hypothetical protein [Rufibacter sp. LB8]|nr:hypothetical protein [Rufibacter sp. LB8]